MKINLQEVGPILLGRMKENKEYSTEKWSSYYYEKKLCWMDKRLETSEGFISFAKENYHTIYNKYFGGWDVSL